MCRLVKSLASARCGQYTSISMEEVRAEYCCYHLCPANISKVGRSVISKPTPISATTFVPPFLVA